MKEGCAGRASGISDILRDYSIIITIIKTIIKIIVL